LNEDTDLLVRSLEGFGVVIPHEHRELLLDDLFILMQDLDLGYSIAQFNFGFFVNELSEVIRRYRIKVPMNLILLLKVLVMILDTGVRLDPAFNIRKELSPYLVRIAGNNAFTVTRAKKIPVSVLETLDAVFDLPRHLDLSLRRFSTGTISLDIVDKDILKFQIALDEASDKLVIGFVVGSLVIGSSVVLRAGPLPVPPAAMWIAVAGYAAAVLVGFYCVYHIIFLKIRQGQ
jgi:ubiquinone biosynthesis protein